MTQEFHLSVTPVGNSQYLVRTERVPFGVPLAEEQLLWTVETWLAQARQLMSDPLQGLMQGSPNSLNLVELGQELYTALFQGTLRDSWVIAQGVAQHRREALRLRLGLKGIDLPRLPWEVMYGTDVPVERLRRQPSSITASPRPLATGTRIIFSRYQWGTRLVEESVPSETNQPLRILMVVSAPTDQEQLKLYREVKQMQQQLQAQPNREMNGEAATDIQLTVLNQPGRERLTQALVQGRYHALHYAGHSDLSAAGGSLYLVNNHTGLTEELTGDDLVELLVNNGIRLAVFNSCRSSYTAASDPSTGRDRNLAEVLVSRGIPAVLAMAEQIPDNVALNLTGLFYHNLKQGFPIDLSLNRARQGLISTYGSHQFYWALPVLYLHPEFDGYLITRDRLDNPADRLSLMPATDRTPTLSQRHSIDAVEHSLEKQPHRGVEEVRVPTVKANTDKLETLEDEALSEEADRQVMAEMLQQLTPRAPQTYAGNPPVPLLGADAANSLSPTVPLSVPPTADENTASLTASLTSEPQPSREPSVALPQAESRRKSGKPRAVIRFLLLPILGAAAGSLAYLAMQRLPIAGWLRLSDPATTPTPEAVSIGDPPVGIDPDQPDGELQAFAVDSFEQQMVDPGIEAVKALLDRDALEEASGAIQAVPEDFEEDPRINFLRGRVAWQGAAAKDGIHTTTQARQFWESAVEADPEVIVYHEALAFAYYVEANWTKVIQTWYSVQSRPERNKNMLNIEAINTLTQKQIAATQSAEKQDAYLRAAVQNYRKVVNRDPEGFTSEALRQNWLWTDAMIQDWESLAQAAQGREGDQPAVSSPEGNQD